MSKAHTIEEIRDYITEHSNGKCKLLSTEYTNYNMKLDMICECGNKFTRTFAKLKLNDYFLCDECMNNLRSKKYRKNIEDIINEINSTGCTYISGEYKNYKSILTIKCKCGNIFQKDYQHFHKGQQQCKQCGKEKVRKSKIKYTIDDVRKILATKNYTLLDTEYFSCGKPLKCLCPNGHEVNIVLCHFLNNKSGCKICANENLKGKNHPNYKGGESEILDRYRKLIKEWKVKIAYKYNFRCALTNSKNDCVVHHLKSFVDIVKESCEELNLPLERKIKDYTDIELEMLDKKVMEKHTLDEGILLQRKVHNKFHTIYGKGNNTKEQFDEFVKKYYPNINVK